jgi:hypothetical protein
MDKTENHWAGWSWNCRWWSNMCFFAFPFRLAVQQKGGSNKLAVPLSAFQTCWRVPAGYARTMISTSNQLSPPTPGQKWRIFIGPGHIVPPAETRRTDEW